MALPQFNISVPPQTAAATEVTAGKISVTKEGLLQIGERLFRVKVKGEVTKNPETLARVANILKKHFGEEEVGKLLSEFEAKSKEPGSSHDVSKAAVNPLKVALSKAGSLTVSRKMPVEGAPATQTLQAKEKVTTKRGEEVAGAKKLERSFSKLETQIQQHTTFKSELSSKLQEFPPAAQKAAINYILDEGPEQLSAYLRFSKTTTSLSDLLQQKGCEGIRSALIDMQGEAKPRTAPDAKTKECIDMLREEITKALKSAHVKLPETAELLTGKEKGAALPNPEAIHEAKSELNNFFNKLGLADHSPETVFDSHLNVQVNIRKLDLTATAPNSTKNRHELIKEEITSIKQQLAATPASDVEAELKLKLQCYALERLNSLSTLREQGVATPSIQPTAEPVISVDARAESPVQVETTAKPSLTKAEKKTAKQAAKRMDNYKKAINQIQDKFSPLEVYRARLRIEDDKNLPLANIVSATSMESFEEALQMIDSESFGVKFANNHELHDFLTTENTKRAKAKPGSTADDAKVDECEKALRKAIATAMQLPETEAISKAKLKKVEDLLADNLKMTKLTDEIRNDLLEMFNISSDSRINLFSCYNNYIPDSINFEFFAEKVRVGNQEFDRLFLLNNKIDDLKHDLGAFLQAPEKHTEAIEKMQCQIYVLTNLVNACKAQNA